MPFGDVLSCCVETLFAEICNKKRESLEFPKEKCYICTLFYA